MPLAKGAAETRSGKQPDNIVAMPRTAKKPEMSAAMVRMIKDAAAGPARVKVSVLVAEPLPPC
jgi:hypothetical protein